MSKNNILTYKAVVLFFVMVIFFPFLVGWEKVTLQEYLLDKQPVGFMPALRGNKLAKPSAEILQMRPYAILERSTSSLYRLKSMHIEMEAWFEDSLFHIKSHFDSDIQNVDSYKTNGRISVSLLSANSYSTSSWVQSYEIRGVPFTWDLEEREWRQEEINISGKDSNNALKYSILRSLFMINEESVAADTIYLLGIEERNGKSCFVVQYKIDPKMFKRWNAVGDITIKTWIDTKDFLPRLLRAEGKIGNMYILQVVNYSGFDSAEEFLVPPEVARKAEEEKAKLEGKVSSFAKEVSQIRGWSIPEKINMEFRDRRSMREFLVGQIEEEYTAAQLENEGFILKWLGLQPKDLDYKETLINSEISSLAGLYDPKSKMVIMGDWLPLSFSEAALVHEIAHAFQDNLVGLDKFIAGAKEKNNYDLTYARKSIIEGEATAIMLEYLLKKDGKSFKDLEDIFTLIEEGLFNQDQYVKENILYNIYGYGANFIQAYLRQHAWTELDLVYKAPPTSMDEIIHPFKYANKNESPPKKQESDINIRLDSGWKNICSVKLGEFFFLMCLRQALEKDIAEKAIMGWRNDNVLVYENQDGERIVVFLSKWNSSANASEFSQAYKEWVNKKNPGLNLIEVDKERVIVSTPDKQLFSCKLVNEWVEVIWMQGQDIEGFKSLIKKVDAGLKLAG